MRQRQTGIGHHTAKLHKGDTSICQQSADLVEQSRLHGTLSAIMYQHFRATILLHQSSHLLF